MTDTDDVLDLPVYQGVHAGTGLHDHVHHWESYRALIGGAWVAVTACQICGARWRASSA